MVSTLIKTPEYDKKNKINKRRDYVVVVELQYCDHHVERERERKKNQFSIQFVYRLILSNSLIFIIYRSLV